MHRWNLLNSSLKHISKFQMPLHTEPLDQEDQDAIILDARAGDLESLREIFTTLVSPTLVTTCRDSLSKSTPLHMAAANDHPDVIIYLMSLVPADQQKKWVDAQNETGNTALHWASLNGNLECVKLLCDEYNADPFIRNSFEHDAIFEAEQNGRDEVETFYLKKYDVEPEQYDEANDETTTQSVQIKEGTEIEQVTKDATEALRQKTQELDLS